MRFLILFVCLCASPALAAPRVVTSITPLQEIAATLMSGVGEAESIIADGASTHHFALRPSHMRRLQQADLVIWIHSHFEAGFGRISETLPRAVSQLELLPALGNGGHDGHIWFSPRSLQQASDIIATRLAEIDPEHATQYRENARQLGARLGQWREQALLRLQQQPPRYITDHEFTGRFEADMGFAPIAAIHDQHDDHGGLGELHELEERLRAQPANCLLTLEAVPAALALELAQKYRLKVISLSSTPGGKAQTPPIIRRLQQFSDALQQCA